MRLRWALAAAVGCFACLGAGASALAATSSTPKGGRISVEVTPNNGATYPIVVVGAIGDYGTATTINKSGKVDPNGNFVRIALKKGGFEVNSTTLNKKANSGKPSIFNVTTCSFLFSASGPVTLFNGSGAYTGIAGTLTINESFAAILPRFTSGKKKGQCDDGNSANPIKENGHISGSGKVTF